MFSIIIPTYNRGYILEDAIRSVQSQTLAAWELLIVDDGSTDDTREVVRRFQEDRRVRYFFQQQGGTSSARNLGLLHARGSILTYLDSDDALFSQYLETAKQYLALKPQKSFALARARRLLELYDKDGVLSESRPEVFKIKSPTIQDFYDWSVKASIGTGFFHKKTLNVRWNETLRLLENLDFIMQCGTVDPEGFLFIPEELCEYKQRYGGDAPANGGRVYQADFTTAPDTIIFTQVLPTVETDQLILSAPTTTAPSTTNLLFQALPLYNLADGDNASHPGDVQQLSQLFSGAIISGLLPRNISDMTVPLRTVPPGSAGNTMVNPNNGNQNDSPTDANQRNNLASTYEHLNTFYQFNTNLESGTLPIAGTTAATGPWFDLYGGSIHNIAGPATGLVYTYGFDEDMYPQVLISNQSVTPTTLLRVVVGGEQ